MVCRFVNKLNYRVRPFPCIHISTAVHTLICIRLPLSFSFSYYVTYRMKTMYILFHPSRHFSQDLWSHLLCLGFSLVSGISFISPLCSLYHSFCFRYAQNTQHSSQNTIMLIIMIISSRWDVEGKTSISLSLLKHHIHIITYTCLWSSSSSRHHRHRRTVHFSLFLSLTFSLIVRCSGRDYEIVCGCFLFKPSLVWNILKYLEM